MSDMCWFSRWRKRSEAKQLEKLWHHCGYCGARFSNWDNGCLLVVLTGSGHDDKFVSGFSAPRQGALANTVQALALPHTLHLAGRDGCVFPGLSETSIRKLAESFQS